VDVDVDGELLAADVVAMPFVEAASVRASS